jgi:hypothetical protein
MKHSEATKRIEALLEHVANGDGRLKLIERLTAAYHAGESPDYVGEFVDSLKTRVKQPLQDRGSR